MSPTIPPIVVRLVCSADKGMSIEEQARSCDLGRQQLARLSVVGWDRWKVAKAQKWCAACGFDFWNLRMTPAQASKVNWASGDPKVVSAMEALYELRNPGAPKPPRRVFVSFGSEAAEVFGCQAS